MSEFFPTRTDKPYFRESTVPPTYMGLDPEDSARYDPEVVDSMMDFYEVLRDSRGFNRVELMHRMFKNPDLNYTELAEEMEASIGTISRNAGKLVESGLISEDHDLNTEGSILFQGFNRYADYEVRSQGRSADSVEVREIEEDLSNILKGVAKSRPNGSRDSKLNAFLHFLSDPRQTVYDVAEKTEVENVKPYFQEWEQNGLVEKVDYSEFTGNTENIGPPSKYVPTGKAWRAEGMISYHFKELWLLNEFLQDVRESASNHTGYLGIDAYRENDPGFDPEWYVYNHFGYDSWQEVLEDAGVPSSSDQTEIMDDVLQTWSENGDTLSREEYREKGDFSPEEVEFLLGEWKDVESLLSKR